MAFVDPSGGSNDSFTLAISHAEGGRAVHDLVREVRPPFSPEAVVDEFCDTLAAYRIRRVAGDHYAGEWPAEQFRKRGVRYERADKTASQLFLELLPLVNARSVALLDHRRLVDQLIGLERRTAFTGKDSVGHPPGAHDDLANAVAGAAVLVLQKTPRARTGVYDGLGVGGIGSVRWLEDEPEYVGYRYLTLNAKGEVIQEQRRMLSRDPKFVVGGR